MHRKELQVFLPYLFYDVLNELKNAKFLVSVRISGYHLLRAMPKKKIRHQLLPNFFISMASIFSYPLAVG